jgi:hypothetical protein
VPNPIHRPAHMTYSVDNVTVVADLPDRPEFMAAGIDPTAEHSARAVFRCGPVTFRFDDPQTAALWASALEVTAAQLRIAQDHADQLAAVQPCDECESTGYNCRAHRRALPAAEGSVA